LSCIHAHFAPEPLGVLAVDAGWSVDEVAGLLAFCVGHEIAGERAPCGHARISWTDAYGALATGLVEGILAASASDLRVTEHDKHPERRRCTLRLTRVGWTGAAAAARSTCARSHPEPEATP
jgi:hypothetical protein